MQLNPGVKTSEFWMGLVIPFLVSIVNAVFGLGLTPEVVLGMFGLGGWYAGARSYVKGKGEWRWPVKKLILALMAFSLTGCMYAKNWEAKDAMGNVNKGTDFNTVHLFSKGSHTSKRWICDAEGNNCKLAKKPRDESNPPMISTGGQPIATGFAGDRVGRGLERSGDSVSVQGSTAKAGASSSARSNSSASNRANWNRW